MLVVEKLDNLLHKIYLFEKQTPDNISKISRITEKNTYALGDMILNEGEKADRMYLIEYGSVKLVKSTGNSEQQIGLLGSGAHFGELPFIDGLERALSVEAIERSTIFEIPYDSLEKLLEEDPLMASLFYQEVAHFLATRLRESTLDLSFIKEHNLKHF